MAYPQAHVTNPQTHTTTSVQCPHIHALHANTYTHCTVKTNKSIKHEHSWHPICKLTVSNTISLIWLYQVGITVLRRTNVNLNVEKQLSNTTAAFTTIFKARNGCLSVVTCHCRVLGDQLDNYTEAHEPQIYTEHFSAYMNPGTHSSNKQVYTYIPTYYLAP